MQKFYKVVKCHKNEDNSRKHTKVSCKADYLSDQLVVTYERKKWIYANPFLLEKGFGLCVFDNLDMAMGFAMDGWCYDNVELWECDIKPMANPSPFRCSLYSKPSINFSFLDDKRCRENWPNHTVLVEAVRLTKRVKIEK